MRLTSLALLFDFFVRGNRLRDSRKHHRRVASKEADDSLLQKFSEFDLPAAADAAELRLHRAPKDTVALFVRMETAELQERPQVVLDSALRLCQLPAAPELHELASNRILQHAANSLAFNSVLRRVKLAAAIQNGCTFNLRLALVAAAWDGANVDLDQAANSSGLLTRWRIAGPFGHYNNVDFERHWLPEADQFFPRAICIRTGLVRCKNWPRRTGCSARVSFTQNPSGALLVPRRHDCSAGISLFQRSLLRCQRSRSGSGNKYTNRCAEFWNI